MDIHKVWSGEMFVISRRQVHMSTLQIETSDPSPTCRPNKVRGPDRGTPKDSSRAPDLKNSFDWGSSIDAALASLGVAQHYLRWGSRRFRRLLGAPWSRGLKAVPYCPDGRLLGD